MICQKIFLPEWDWVCMVFYETGKEDADIVLSFLRDCGCDMRDIEDAEANLKAGKMNTGLTYTSFSRRRSVMAISRTSSAAEFQDTFDHEKGHLAMHICQALEIDPFGEEYQYLTGAIGRRMFPVAQRFMCDHCRRSFHK